jgi:hypothetical protein
MSDPYTSPDLVPVISAATALVAVIVSPLVSWIIAKRQIDIAKLQITASNVSSKRQVWIDELRRDVAEALALASRIEELKRPSPGLNREEQLEVFDRRMEAELQTVELLMRIKLRLNPNEQEHNDLVAAFQELSNAAPNPQPGETDADRQRLQAGFRAARGNVLGITQTILKSEWNRVRKGE